MQLFAKEKAPLESAPEALALFVCTTSLSAVALLTAGLFEPLRAVSAGLCFTLLIWCLRPETAETDPRERNTLKETAGILAIVACALFFRSDPYLWVGGGQDQGVYVSMASHLERNGTLFVQDQVRENLPPSLVEKYDKKNLKLRGEPDNIPGRFEGSYLPGLDVADLSESRYVFRFYPVHPVWMAIFGKAFGATASVYSLTLFSLLSIYFFYLTVKQITNNKLFGFAAAGFLSLNPLHSFFSKFPASEVVALAFSLCGLFFLIKALSPTTPHRWRNYFLLVSALGLTAMFFTRISGFFFAPLLVFSFGYNEIFSRSTNKKLSVRVYLLALVLLYGASVAYGLLFSFPYSWHIYNSSFKPLLGEDWGAVLIGLIALSCLFCAVCYVWGKNSASYAGRLIAKCLDFSLALTPYLVVFSALVSAYFLYQLGFTDQLRDSHRFAVRWPGLVGSEWAVVPHWSLAVFVAHLSPGITLFLLLFSRTAWRHRDTTLKFFLLATAFFFAYIAALKWFVPYQYYFARYQLSELLPLTVICSVLLLSKILASEVRNWKKNLAVALMISSLPYSAIITSGQLRLKEQAGLLESLNTIEASAGPGAVILINSRLLHLPGAGELKTSLLFHTSLQILSVSEENEPLFASFFCDQGINVHKLSKVRILGADSIKIRAPIYQRVASNILRPSGHQAQPLFLQHLNCDTLRSDVFSGGSVIYEHGVRPYFSVRGLQYQLLFTEPEVVLEFTEALPPREDLIIEAFGHTPRRVKKSNNFMRVWANKELLSCKLEATGSFRCELNSAQDITQLIFKFDAWQPREQGINNDTNFYGLDIKSIKAVGGT